MSEHVSEAEFDAMFGSTKKAPTPIPKGYDRDVADFRRIGFRPVHAESAARALKRGSYETFEEAAAFALPMTGWAPDNTQSVLNKGALAKVLVERGESSGSIVQERAMPSSARPLLRETSVAVTGAGALLEAQIINAGVGSSGYYSPEVLQAAAKAKVFAAGLHVYVDHPTESEQFERPERTIRDLAGALETDAVYESGALRARVRVFESHRALIVERASVIGMSIRASASMSSETRDGLPIVEAIVQAHSVDFVTHAGRGGRIISVS